MSPLKYNTKIQILLFSLACTIIIFNLNKKSNVSSFSLRKLSFSLRNLIDINQVDKRCKNTPKDFLKKYNDSISASKDENKPTKNITLDKYQKVLKEMIENKKLEFNKIKQYLPRLLIYLIFLIVDLIIIILWFVLCGQCCCGKKYKDQKTGCSKFFFFLFFFLNVIAIIICAYGFIISPNMFKSINGVICSLYKLVFHFTEGANKDFPNNNWKGFEGINSLIQEYNETYSNISDLEIDICLNETNGCVYYKNTTFNLKSKTEIFFETLKNSSLIINLISEPINKTKNGILEDIEKIMEKLDKYCILGLYGLFCVIALFCLLGLITLTAYFVCGCSCISCLFHLIWNIQMIIIIVIILAGICFGTVGIASKDLVEILKYAKSENHLLEEKPFLLRFNGEYQNQTNICLNKDGDLYTYVFGKESINFDSDIETLFDQFQSNYTKFNSENTDQESEMDKAYNTLKQEFYNLTKLNKKSNISNIDKFFDCSFLKRDLNFLINEIKEEMSKKLSFFSLVVIIPVLVAFLSIIIGVMIISNYSSQSEVIGSETNDRHNKSKAKNTKNNMDSSSDNLRK